MRKTIVVAIWICRSTWIYLYRLGIEICRNKNFHTVFDIPLVFFRSFVNISRLHLEDTTILRKLAKYDRYISTAYTKKLNYQPYGSIFMPDLVRQYMKAEKVKHLEGLVKDWEKKETEREREREREDSRTYLTDFSLRFMHKGRFRRMLSWF